MSYLYALCITNAVLLVVTAALLWSSSRHSADREQRLATELETLQCFLRRTADDYAGELRRLETTAETLRTTERQGERRADAILPLAQLNRLAGAASSADDLSAMTGLGRAEAQLLMRLRSAKADSILAENEHATM